MKTTSARTHVLSSKCLFALSTLTSAAALAPAAWAQSSGEAAATVEEIVVTGSRISQLGYQAPTPVTVATAEALQRAAPTSIPDALNKLPQFLGSNGPARQNQILNNPIRGNVLNLRALGPTRTLILLDGIRVPPTTYTNTVNVDTLPSLLVERVDVVTGGASSVYGSDAVAGVVNFVTDSDFSGVKAVAQGGLSRYGDAGNMRLGVAAGRAFADDRLHIIASADMNEQDSYLADERPRAWRKGANVGSVVGSTSPPGSRANPLINVSDTRISLVTPGGWVTNGPFANTVFIAPGVYRPLNRGTPTGSPANFLADSDFTQIGPIDASAYYRNLVGFGKATYDISDTTSAYVQIRTARNDINYRQPPNTLQGAVAVRVFSGNPYIPAALQAQLTSTNTPSFNVSKHFDSLGRIRGFEEIDNDTFGAGLEGKLGSLDWRLDYSHGDSEYNLRATNQFDLLKQAAATDAVIDPATGRIVCRVLLNSDPAVRARYAGCLPLNVLGVGSEDPAAGAYALGTSTYSARNTMNVVVGSVSGALFDLPAGAVSFAAGAEYRTQKLDLVSNSDPGIPQDITGLRGIPANTVRFYQTNVPATHGSTDVKEGFAELAVPVLRDSPWLGSIELNGAFRSTDYKTSGRVETWKAGGSWTPFDGLRLRATKSRDIRAPTLMDLFGGRQFNQSGVIFDPLTGTAQGSFTAIFGNPNLDPEIGDTWTVGAVFQPTFVDGLSLALDYYKIGITDAITTLSISDILLDCYRSGGTAASCSQIIRPLGPTNTSPANYPSEIRVRPTNAALLEAEGLDIDLTYRLAVGPGELTSRLFASKVFKYAQQNDAGRPRVDNRGVLQGIGLTQPVPSWRGNLSLNYDLDRFSVFVQENYVGTMEKSRTQVWVNNHVRSYFTTDLTLTYQTKPRNADLELFFTVNDVFEGEFPIYSGVVSGLAVDTNQSLYNINGRSYVAGARLSF